MEDILKVFFQLWKEGCRFLPKGVEDDLRYCVQRKIAPGHYEVITIKGMKEMAKKGLLKLDNVPMTPEEVDMFWNLAAFFKICKKKAPASR